MLLTRFRQAMIWLVEVDNNKSTLVHSFFGRRRRLWNCPGIFPSVLLLEVLCLTRLRKIGSLVLSCPKSKTKTLWHFFLNFIGNRLTKFISQGPFCIAKQCKHPKQDARKHRGIGSNNWRCASQNMKNTLGAIRQRMRCCVHSRAI